MRTGYTQKVARSQRGFHDRSCVSPEEEMLIGKGGMGGLRCLHWECIDSRMKISWKGLRPFF